VTATRAADRGVAGCEAATGSGGPCPSAAAFLVDDPARGPLALCGPHAKAARLRAARRPGSVPCGRPTRRPPSPHGRRPWTAEEEAFLREYPELVASDAGAYLGRTPSAVYVRRSRLRREGRG
jgi:hypothetical protein